MSFGTCRWTAVIAAVMLGSCGGGNGRLEPRFVAVHNAMTAMGLAQTGPISEGSLPEGADATLQTSLSAGDCYTFVALGTTQVRDLNVRVLDEAGEEVGRDTTHDRQAAAQVCPESSGDFEVVVTMESGQGGYMLSSWSGMPRGAAVGAAVAGGTAGGVEGTCQAPLELEVGRPVEGSTQGANASMTGSCFSGNAPERVYRLVVEQRSQVSVVLQSQYDGSIYIQRSCGQTRSEVACNDDAPNTSRSQIDATLDEGEYFLIVDGYGNESGSYDLIVSMSELQPLSAVCGDAPPITPGTPVTGSTSGQPNYFQATCAGGARSPDRVYRLDVPSRSRLRLRQQSDHDGAIYVRRDCESPTSEVACNDDFRDQRHSLLTTIVDSGRYYVYTDGYSAGQAGNFTLGAELTSGGGGGAAGDACGAVGTASVGQQFQVDTFEARDDYAGSCGGQGAPDVVYELSVQNRSRLRAQLGESEFEGVAYVQSTCGDATTEEACQPIPQGGSGTVDAVLQPGTHYLVIDGQRPDTFGAVQVDVQLDDLRALERACRRAPMIRPGRVINGDTLGDSDDFQATCAAGAQSNDTIYRLRIRRRSTVRINMSSDYDGALYVRRDCTDASTELACNDDHNDNRHSFVETTLDPGVYYVFVDGFRTGNAGTFTMDVDVSRAP